MSRTCLQFECVTTGIWAGLILNGEPVTLVHGRGAVEVDAHQVIDLIVQVLGREGDTVTVRCFKGGHSHILFDKAEIPRGQAKMVCQCKFTS